MARKSSYRLGRRLKASMRDRLDYITYLHSGAKKTGGMVPTPPGRLRGIIQQVSDFSGFLRITQRLVGQIDDNSNFAGILFPPAALRGSINQDSEFSGQLSLLNQMRGTIDGEGDFGGSLTVIHGGAYLKGSIDDNADISGKVQITRLLAGTILDNVDLWGHLYPPMTLKGQIDGGDVWTGKIAVNIKLKGQVEGEGDFFAHLARAARLRGQIDGEGSLAADLHVIASGIPASYLIVAGGGGGGTCVGTRGGTGGGGGGGVIELSGVVAPGTYAVVIGAGGASNANGSNSTFNGLTAIGGGKGGGTTAPLGQIAAGNGGSGGGGVGFVDVGSDQQPGGTATTGQGFAGGAGAAKGSFGQAGSGGGGGGATVAGVAGVAGTMPVPSKAGNGGTGKTSTISGASLVYGSGGGAGVAADDPTKYGIAGPRGGNGGTYTGAGQPAVANSGGGGGGAGANNGGLGGAGGSGTVIISYPGAARGTGGTITSVGGNTIHTFTANGSLVLKASVRLAGTVDGEGAISGNASLGTPRYLAGTVAGEGAVIGNITIPSAADTRYNALVASWTTQPTTTRGLLIKKTITDLMSAGIWDKLDNLFVFATEAQDQANQDWTKSFNAVGNSAQQIWTLNKGYNSNGPYLNNGYNPSIVSTPLKKLAAASASMFMRIADTGLAAGAVGGSDSAQANIIRINASGTIVAAMNTPEGSSLMTIGGQTGYNKLISVSRTANALAKLYLAGAPVASDTTNYTPPVIPNTTLGFVGASLNSAHATYLFLNVAIVGYGAGMTDAEHATLNTILEYYMANL